MNQQPQPRNVYRDVTILLVVLALILLGIGLYAWRTAPLYALVPYAFLALCPLAMWFMMRSMGGNKNGPAKVKLTISGAVNDCLRRQLAVRAGSCMMLLACTLLVAAAAALADEIRPSPRTFGRCTAFWDPGVA